MSSCPVCNCGTKTKFRKSSINLLECKNCKFVFVFPIPSIQTQEKYYEESHKRGLYRIHSDDDKFMRKKLNKNRFDEIKKFNPKGNLLDIGCAAGFFLDEANQNGLECYGIELSDEAVKKAKMNHKNIFQGYLEQAQYPENFFDIITMYDIIEHVVDLDSIFKEICRITRPGSLLVISTPDISSWHAKLMGKNWGMITPQEHLFYFSPQNMKIFLKKHDFEVLELRKNYKIFSWDYLFKMSEFYFPKLYKFFSIIKKLLPKNFSYKERLFYFGEMFVVGKKIK